MSKILHEIEGSSDLRIFFCPGCQCAHQVSIVIWKWNGSSEKPTLEPSILVNADKKLPTDEVMRQRGLDEEDVAWYKKQSIRCHSFVRDGNIEFLADCEHKLAGKTVPLEEF